MGIQSPFLLFCAYPLLYRRLAWLASPKVLVPALTLVCVFFFIVRYENPHFLVADALILGAYAILSKKYGYSNLNALMIGLMILLAIDQIWQIPDDIFNWSQSWIMAAQGLVTAGWNFMSVPFIFYFIKKDRRQIKVHRLSWILLGSGILSLAWDYVHYGGYAYLIAGDNISNSGPYLSIIPWFLFFLSVGIDSA